MAVTAERRFEMPVEGMHVLATWGSTSGDLLRRIDQMGLGEAGVRIEPVSDDGRVVRVALVADDLDRLQWCVGLVKAGLGDLVLGDDGATLEGQVVELLQRQGLGAVVAASPLGGVVADRLAVWPGSADVFRGEAPTDGDATPMVLAKRAARSFGVDVAVAAATTGVDLSGEGPPAGTIVIGSWIDGEAMSATVGLEGLPGAVGDVAASCALDHLRHQLLARERRRLGRP